MPVAFWEPSTSVAVATRLRYGQARNRGSTGPWHGVESSSGAVTAPSVCNGRVKRPEREIHHPPAELSGAILTLPICIDVVLSLSTGTVY
jgi:hypothetical protein